MINFAHKYFNYFLKNPCNELNRARKFNQTIDILSDLSDNKVTGANSIPIKIMKLAENCIANNLSVLLNPSFTSGVFSEKLKIGSTFYRFNFFAYNS